MQHKFIFLLLLWLSDQQLVMGPGQKFLTQVGLDQFFVARVGSGRVSHLWSELNLENFP